MGNITPIPNTVRRKRAQKSVVLCQKKDRIAVGLSRCRERRSVGKCLTIKSVGGAEYGRCYCNADYAFRDNANEMDEKKDTTNGKERQKRGE